MQAFDSMLLRVQAEFKLDTEAIWAATGYRSAAGGPAAGHGNVVAAADEDDDWFADMPLPAARTTPEQDFVKRQRTSGGSGETFGQFAYGNSNRAQREAESLLT